MAIALPILQRTPEWLEARQDGIGASEAAAAMGLSRWESPLSLWARKLGLVPAPDPTPEMELGILMEPVIAQLYERETGERLRRANRLLQHPRHPWMLASLDRVRTGRRIVELKHTARGEGYGEPGTDEVPDEVLAQLVHQMAVLDAPEADVAALVGGRPPVRIYTVRRDRVAEEAVIEAERDFWRHVEERLEPDVDGSESTRRTLVERYRHDTGEVLDADANDELLGLLREYRAIARNERQLEVAKKAVVNRLRSELGEAHEIRATSVGRVVRQSRLDTAWRAIADAYRAAYRDLRDGVVDKRGLRALDDEDLETLVSIHTTRSERLMPYWLEETDA